MVADTRGETAEGRRRFAEAEALTTGERTRLRRLQAEDARLRMERDLLKRTVYKLRISTQALGGGSRIGVSWLGRSDAIGAGREPTIREH